MRQKELLLNRDIAIVHKFYELYDVKRMRMDDVLDVMSKQYFFLNTNYIYSLIFYNKKNNDLYSSLVESKSKKVLISQV